MISMQQFESSYQKVIERFTRDDFMEDLQLAKLEFFKNGGTLDELSPNYNLRMSQFFDWYFLVRKLKGHLKTPLLVCHEQRDLRLEQNDLEAIEILKHHQHSIFEQIKSNDETIVVKDIFTGKKVIIELNKNFFDFDDKEFFEGRYVEVDKKNYFLKGLCFHPESAQKFILSQIKKFQKDPDLHLGDFLIRLNKMRYKFEQYRHVKVEMIYNDENKLGL